MVKRVVAIILCVLLGAVSVSTYAALTVRLDRDQIRLNETVRLTVESDNLNSNQNPDFTPISEHFEIIGTASSQNVSIVNGQQSAIKKWILELQPKDIGSFSLGPVTLESEQSRRIRISVMPVAENAEQGADIFLEAELDVEQPYVQQQVILTVRLFLAKRLLDGALADPEPVDTLVQRLGEDARYETTRGNKRFSVYQRTYALFPQKSGAIEIPPVGFQGLIDDDGTGSQSEFGGFFQQGKRIRAQTQTLNLQVKPPAASFTGPTWLPAKKIIIRDVSEANPEYVVGQPVTRKIQLSALGLAAEQLTDIAFAPAEGLRYYPDQPLRENQDDANNIVGLQLNSIAIIPSKSGPLEVPGVQIKWWNTETDSMDIASLPPMAIDVGAAVQSQNTALATTTETPEQINIEPTAGPETKAGTNIWKWFSIGSALLWLATMPIILYRYFGRNKPVTPPSTNDKLKGSNWLAKFRSACQQNDPVFARKYLLSWAHQHYGQTLSLEKLVDKIGDDDLSNQLRRLDQALYAEQDLSESGNKQSGDPWSGAELWSCMAKVVAQSRAEKPKRSADLLPLYP